MSRRAMLLGGAFVLVVATLTATWWGRPAARASGPLAHEVYVWQRAWNAPVLEAVRHQATNFARIVPLKAEISWKDRRPQLTRVALDYASLTNLPLPVGLALRVGPHAGPFTTNDPASRFIIETAAALVSEARTNGLQLSELQIDFDCAESKLDGYRVWVEAIQHRVAPTPVTITALPSWLNARGFQSLVEAATNYVLQVHSVSRPRSAKAPFTLCDPGATRRAVERAGRIGVPFRVALPTYGYTLAFRADGTFIGLSAEGPRPNWPTNATIREVSSDPLALSKLARDWTADRPAPMTSIIWYRLPTRADRLNWRWPTLGAIVAGRVPTERFRADARRVEPGLVEIILANTGELDLSSRPSVTLRWSNARLVAADALTEFELGEQKPDQAQLRAAATARLLRPGESAKIAWLRFDHDCEVTCEAEKL